jgi:hypothetical protein
MKQHLSTIKPFISLRKKILKIIFLFKFSGLCDPFLHILNPPT